MAIPLEDDELYTIAEAATYLNVARSSVYNYEKRGQLTPVLRAGVKHWRRSELDKIEPYIDRTCKGRPPRKQQAAAEVFEQALARVVNEQTPAQLMQAMGITDTSSTRDIATQLQRYIARLVLEFHAVEVLVADLEHPDWKARHSAAEKLLAKISPTVKAVEITRSPDLDAAQRQERAAKALQEIAEHGRLRRLAPEVRILEAEDAEVVES
jgi:hypothetical protein